VGVTATVSADYAGEMAGNIIKELGPGLFTAGILGLLVDPFLRRELARDAFLALFRYVLPNEFKDEVEKILRFEFVAEKQLWTAKIDKINGDDDTVLVTTSFDKTVKNRSKSSRKNRGYYNNQRSDFACCGKRSASLSSPYFIVVLP
jgi:hypothetical protein